MRKIDLGGSSTSIKSASVVQLGSKMINVVAQLVITMVLARLLTPEEYGTVAVLTAFSGIFSVLADAGISAAIAQSQDLDSHDYERLFFLSLIIGIGLTLVFCLLSFVVAWFYGDSIYVPLGCLMSLAVLFNALNMVPNGVLIKERKFKLIALRLVACTIAVGAIAIALAFLGFGCFAIVMNTVLTALFVFLWNLNGTGIHMSFGSVRGVWGKVGSFSMYNMGSSLVGWFANNLDSLMVGKLFGAAELGYYNKAYSLYGYPLSILATPITSTLLPFLAPLQHDEKALDAKFTRVFRRLSFISALCTAVMHVCASEIILVMYGQTWAPAIPMLSILAFAVYSRGINGSFGALLSAVGRTDLLMRSTTINTIMTICSICLGGALGSVTSLSACVAIAYNLEMVIPSYFCAKYCLGVSLRGFVSRMLPDLACCVVTIIAFTFLPLKIGNVYLALVLKVILVLGVMGLGKALVDYFVFHEKPRLRFR